MTVAQKLIATIFVLVALISLLVVVVWGWPLALTGMGASPLVYSLDIVE